MALSHTLHIWTACCAGGALVIFLFVLLLSILDKLSSLRGMLLIVKGKITQIEEWSYAHQNALGRIEKALVDSLGLTQRNSEDTAAIAQSAVTTIETIDRHLMENHRVAVDSLALQEAIGMGLMDLIVDFGPEVQLLPPAKFHPGHGLRIEDQMDAVAEMVAMESMTGRLSVQPDAIEGILSMVDRMLEPGNIPDCDFPHCEAGADLLLYNITTNDYCFCCKGHLLGCMERNTEYEVIDLNAPRVPMLGCGCPECTGQIFDEPDAAEATEASQETLHAQ